MAERRKKPVVVTPAEEETEESLSTQLGVQIRHADPGSTISTTRDEFARKIDESLKRGEKELKQLTDEILGQ